jgi:D-alanyl-D-alanine carboxypeptidase
MRCSVLVASWRENDSCPEARAGTFVAGHRLRVIGSAAALLTTLSLAGWSGPSAAQARHSVTAPSVRASLRAALNQYLSTRGTAEHISGVALRVTFRGRRPGINLPVGTTRYGGGSPLSSDMLWQIGSNTKAFTAVMLLQLEAEHKLSIHDTLGKWLPRYRAWRHITVEQLLNMTSGIPDYEDVPAFLRDYARAPNTVFSLSRLVSYARGLPLLKGWNYSNTNYVLAQMIIEKATHDTYQHQLRRRIAVPLSLPNLFFNPTGLPAAVIAREPAGYYFDSAIPQLAPLLGKDVRTLNLSWAPANGGIVTSLQDMTKWDRVLYQGRVLPRRQQRELESLISEKTGRAIKRTTPADPSGFGLGVHQSTSSVGRAWDYEGENLGDRVLHVYVPRSGTLIALAANSTPSTDQLGGLALSVIQILRKAGLS